MSPSIPLVKDAVVVVRDLNEIADDPERLRISIETLFLDLTEAEADVSSAAVSKGNTCDKLDTAVVAGLPEKARLSCEMLLECNPLVLVRLSRLLPLN